MHLRNRVQRDRIEGFFICYERRLAGCGKTYLTYEKSFCTLR